MAIYKYNQRYRNKPVLRFNLPIVMIVISAIGFVGGNLIYSGKVQNATLSQVAIEQTSAASKQITDEVSQIPRHEKLTGIDWPGYGQAAYGTDNDGVIAKSSTATKPVPVASLAKVITAIVIADKFPIDEGGSGTIMFTQDDVDLFNSYLINNGVVLPIEIGQKITVYQALEAMLLTSANNLTDSLVVKLFGSTDAYVEYANSYLEMKGLSDTRVADAAGFSPNTVSTAENMVEIGILYMKNPVLRQIAEKSQTNIPELGGILENRNSKLNNEHIVGLKIGFTNEAKSTFIAADIDGDTSDELSVAVVLGANSIPQAMTDTAKVLQEATKNHRSLISDN